MSTSGLLRHLKAKHSILPEKSALEVDSSAKRCKLDSQPKITSALCRRESIEEIVAHLIACDGFSVHGITNGSFIRTSLALGGYMLPNNHSDVMKLVYKQYEITKDIIVSEFQNRKLAGGRFSFSLDEYKSLQNRLFINNNVHHSGGHVSLGMIGLKGKMNAENFNQCIQTKLEKFKLSYKNDIICSVTDGASVMAKMGRILPCEHQYKTPLEFT